MLVTCFMYWIKVIIIIIIMVLLLLIIISSETIKYRVGVWLGIVYLVGRNNFSALGDSLSRGVSTKILVVV